MSERMKTVNQLAEKTVVLDLVFHKPGCTRPMSGDGVVIDVDPNWISYRKTIIQNADYKAAQNLVWDTTAWLRTRCLPNRIFKRGMHLIPVQSLQEISDYLDEAERKFKAHADAFLAEYDQVKATAKERLASKFNDADYPSEAYLRRAFWVERQLIEIGVPAESKVGSVISDMERAKAQKKWSEAAEDVTFALREQFRDLVSSLAERLEPNPDGSKKALHESALVKVLDWMKLFQNRNVLNDTEMDSLIAQAKNVLKGRARMVDEIRGDTTLRSKLAGEMSKIKIALDKTLENVPSRRIVFDD